jgi:two-component system sensor histidine kinase BaeS
MSFRTRLFLALVLLLLALLALFAGLSRLALQQSLGQYAAEIEIGRLGWLERRLMDRYAQGGDWSFLDEPGAWQRLTGEDRPPPAPGFSRMRDGGPERPGPPPDGFEGDGQDRPPPKRPMPGEDGFRPSGSGAPPPPPPRGEPSIYQRLAVLDAGGRRVAGATVDDLAHAVRKPLQDAAGREVGQLVLAPAQGIQSEADRVFARRLLVFLLATGSGGLVLALGVAGWLGGRWLQPVAWLTQGARQMADGQRGVRVPVRGHDELAVLARSFNTMAESLQRVEDRRQQWLGDVAHELRTPVAAMRAEVEALQDGVRPWDAEAAGRLHRQILRLGRLVDDLRAALDASPDGQADAEAVAIVPLLRQAAEDMRPRLAEQGLALEADLPPALDGVRVWADPLRLSQLVQNLLENSLRYTDRGGRVRLSAAVDGVAAKGEAPQLVLRVADSAPGVQPEELPRLFDRFYRGDASRSRAHGGSGLGLAICRAIVMALGGRIRAEASELGGLLVTVALPVHGAVPSGAGSAKAGGGQKGAQP